MGTVYKCELLQAKKQELDVYTVELMILLHEVASACKGACPNH